MKIAIQNSWPNLSVSAEREFIARFLLAGKSLGWTVKEVVTSDEIYAFAPDAVIVTHEFTPKLTKFPTIGLIWSPIAFFAPDPRRIRNILSYDGYLVATQSLRAYVEKLLADHGKSAPISAFDFLPTALGDGAPTPDFGDLSLFYAGVHWDGGRHDGLFAELQHRVPLSIYGNAAKWAFAGKDYRGTIPFDGRSVSKEIARCGVALSLHTPDHRGEDIPSMRLFEAASAGAVIISDAIPFAVREFGDSLLYVEPSADPRAVADQIAAHIGWLRANPDAARDLAARSSEVFRQRFTLEGQLSLLPEFVDSVRASMGHEGEPDHGLVEVIIRVGSRPAEMVRRALQSVADQTYPRIGLLIVGFRDVPGLEEMLAGYAPRFERIRRIAVPDNGMRSTALWEGLKAADGAFLSNLDDDDVIHPTHVASQVACLVHHRPEPLLVYSGVIEVQEESGHWFEADNYAGDIGKVIEERRRLRFLEPFSRDRMLRFDNFIQSNAWMIRRSALTKDILVDPELRVAEDMLFYLLLIDRGPFVPTWRASADWNWRSNSKDNSMFATKDWAEGEGAFMKRLAAHGVHLVPPARDAAEPLTVRGVIRRPSILLGPLAPRWRRFKKDRRLRRAGSDGVLRRVKKAMKAALNRCGLYVSSMKSQKVKETLLLERDSLIADRNWLISERDALKTQRVDLVAERDRLVDERNEVSAQRSGLIAQVDRLLDERKQLAARQDDLVVERDGFLGERDELYRQRDALRTETDGFAAEIDGLLDSALAANGGGDRKSQLGQDIVALLVNGFKRGGFFVEFGATNGVDLSNTCLLEKTYGWKGILAEPAPMWHEDLKRNRSCMIETDCVWSTTGETLDFDMVSEGEFSTISSFAESDAHAAIRRNKATLQVTSISLMDLLRKHDAPARIDYLSIDTEGSEYEILRNFDFEAYRFNFISVEHNFTANRERLKALLEAQGYRRICPQLSRWDDWYLAMR